MYVCMIPLKTSLRVLLATLNLSNKFRLLLQGCAFSVTYILSTHKMMLLGRVFVRLVAELQLKSDAFHTVVCGAL